MEHLIKPEMGGTGTIPHNRSEKAPIIKPYAMKKSKEVPFLKQGCGSGYVSTASASTPIASASTASASTASVSTASAFTNKKRENDC